MTFERTRILVLRCTSVVSTGALIGLAACGADAPHQGGEISTAAAPVVPAATPSMLHAQNRNIVNSSGSTVRLRGFNLGAWMVFEKWMSPLDSGSLADSYEVIQKLDSRFGVATEQSLIKAYQQTWITTADLDNVKNAGYNALRVPVWYGDFYVLSNISNSGWRADAFDMLDWVVSNAGARGIYVIIDMHGVVGGQGNSDSTGHQNQNLYWNDDNNKGNTSWMWWQIANHFKGNPAVAGYDLINEPTGAPSTQAVWDAYNSLYSSIRSADPDHMIFMEGAFGNWNWDMLPPPSQYGYTNVVYEMHEYQFNGTEAQVRSGADHQVADFNNHASWNVPGYIGEFNDFQYPNAWTYSKNAYDSAGLSWTMWAYKSTSALNPNHWGWYGPTSWKATPNISSNSSSTIQSDWQQWGTASAFAKDTSLGL